MITTTYNYQETLAASVKANWRVEDIIGGDKRIDFTIPFMPNSLARVNAMSFLRDDEKILLNQIRGYGYLYTFGLVEEFILPFVLDHVRPHLRVPRAMGKEALSLLLAIQTKRAVATVTGSVPLPYYLLQPITERLAERSRSQQ